MVGLFSYAGEKNMALRDFLVGGGPVKKRWSLLLRSEWIRHYLYSNQRTMFRHHVLIRKLAQIFAVAQWLRCCVTNRKVAGSIPAVSGFFIDIKSFRSHYGPGVDSASNRNEYQDYFLGVKAAGA